MDYKLLNLYIKEGIAVKDLGDGAWGWTENGISEIPEYLRRILSGCLYNDEFWLHQGRKYEKELNQLGYAYDGYPLEG